METQRKLIIGYDLCDDHSQIMCYSYKTFEPIPISASSQEERYEIPTALGVRPDTKMWQFGDEAVKLSEDEEGIYIDQLLTKVKREEEVYIQAKRYTGIALLEKYLRKTMTLVKNYFPTEQITKLVITLKDMDDILVKGIYQALGMMGIEKDRAIVVSHATAFLYYVLNQERSLWNNDVGLFHYDEQGLQYHQISINRRRSPAIASLSKKDFSHIMDYEMLENSKEQLPYTFTNIAQTALLKQIVSTLYFTGKGFQEPWAMPAIQNLCTGRRAFVGSNLYAKGACYTAKEMSGDQKLDQYILLHDEMITSTISIRVFSDSRWKELPLIKAASSWNDVSVEVEVIQDDSWEIEFSLQNIITREVTREKIILTPLEQRANRMTRLGILLTYTDREHLKVTIEDLGFGTLVTGTGLIEECTIEMR